MKILLISNMYPPVFLGGYEIGASWVGGNLQAQGHDVLLWTAEKTVDAHGADYRIIRHEQPLPHPTMPAGPCFFGLNVLDGVLRDRTPSSFPEVLEILRDFIRSYPAKRAARKKSIEDFEPELVLIFNPACLLDPIFAELREISLLRGVPHLHLVSDDWPLKWQRSHPLVYFRDFWEDSKAHEKVHVDEIDTELLSLAQSCENAGIFNFVAFPDYDRTAYTSKFLLEKCSPAFQAGIPESVIHWGLPEIESTPAVDPRRFSDPAPLRLIYCGQIRPHKGLIRILMALPKMNKPHLLTVIGDDQSEYGEFCRRFVEESGLTDQVTFTGKLPPSVVRDLLASDGEIFLLPSLRGGFEGFEEPFSIVLLQAMAAGLVVASSFSGGSKEAFVEGQSGLFLDPDSEASIVACINKLEDDRLLAKNLAMAARERAMGQYSIETMVKQIIDFAHTPVEQPPLFYAVRNAAIDPANSGCVRVTRRLAQVLEDQTRIRFSTWDVSTGILHALARDQAEVLSRYNGPKFAVENAGGGQLSLASLHRHELDGGWLALPEIIPADQFDHILAEAKRNHQRTFAIFYDSIALLEPDFCNDEIRANHRAYMERLAQCDLVIPISHFSEKCLLNFWRENEIAPPAVATVLLPGEFSGKRLGADSSPDNNGPIKMLCVSTLEPRKNHARLLAAYTSLKARCPELELELHLVGNSYAGAPEITDRVIAASEADPSIQWWRIVDDATLTQLYTECHFTVYPSMIEGYGLPIVESIWHARPCLCSNGGVMAELGAMGGCEMADVKDSDALSRAMQTLATDTRLRHTLTLEASQRPLGTWQDYGAEILSLLKSHG